MNQVRIYVQSGDQWFSCGTGMLHFFQVTPELQMRELLTPADFNTAFRSLFALVELSDDHALPETELRMLQLHFSVLNSRPFRIPHVIMFYDLLNGDGFEYDLESWLTRESDQLDPHRSPTTPNRHQFYLRRHLPPHLGVPGTGRARPAPRAPSSHLRKSGVGPRRPRVSNGRSRLRHPGRPLPPRLLLISALTSLSISTVSSISSATLKRPTSQTAANSSPKSSKN